MFTRLVVLAGLLGALAGCESETPAGPVVNNSGDDAQFCIAQRDAGCVTPAPVVVPPVVIEPVITEGAEG